MKKVLLHYLRPYYVKMAFGFVMKLIGAILELLLPWMLAYMIDYIIPTKEKSHIYGCGLIMLLCCIGAMLLNIKANQRASKVASDVTRAIRHDLFSKITYLSNDKTDYFTKPSLISRLTTDTYNVHQMLGRAQRMGVRAPILVIGGMALTLTLDPVLTLVLAAIMPLICYLTFHVSKKSVPLFTVLQEAIDVFVRMIREDTAGIRVIKALSKTEYEKKRYDKINKEIVHREKKANITMAIVSPSLNLLLNIGLVLVIIVGSYRVNLGLTQAGTILAFLSYFTIILNALMTVSRMFVEFSKAIASANRIMEVIDSPEDMLVEVCQKLDQDAYIRFEHVSFSYKKVEANLEDIDFSLQKGETLGIIGATGAGKSTLVQLLMRFYDTDEGNIYIDGENIRSIPFDSLRTRFGVVFQNDVLFEDSISENIRLGRDISDEQLMDVITYAKAKDFVMEKGGFGDKVNIRGANLSGGQKQRVLISRALAAHPEILILDDASSALDYKTDADLRKNLRTYFADTTTIIVAQRISSIMHADHIMVLDDGKMADYGTHDELLERCQIYREISDSQMGTKTA